jgi:3-oxoacyl-[acyl-carrier protein] reductase
MDFAGRVLLLTGASGGIGAAIAQLFYQAGASVLLADVQEAPVRELARALDPSGKRTESIKYDASRPDDATAAVRLCLERFGKIDFLVPDAAIYEDQPFLTMTDEQWRKTLAINLDGVFYICRRAIAVMRPGSAVVNIASDAAHQGSSVEHSHYGTSKGGVLTLTKSLAREHAPNIRVNAVSPGTTDTPMAQNVMRIRGKEILASIPMGRLATAPEIADTVASLCSDAATYITGQGIQVNGASYM